MTVTISLAPEEEKKLAARAASSGQELSAYVHQLIKKDISLPPLAELLAPVHDAVERSGMSPRELDELLQSAMNDSRANRGS